MKTKLTICAMLFCACSIIGYASTPQFTNDDRLNAHQRPKFQHSRSGFLRTQSYDDLPINSRFEAQKTQISDSETPIYNDTFLFDMSEDQPLEEQKDSLPIFSDIQKTKPEMID